MMENRLDNDALDKVSGGTGNEYEELAGYKYSPRASWCPYCQSINSVFGYMMIRGII